MLRTLNHGVHTLQKKNNGGRKDHLLECIPTLNGCLLFSIKPSIPPLMMCIIINKCTWHTCFFLGKNLFINVCLSTFYLGSELYM
ncbi:unnamed protein product [Musa acuminata subsp. malaccensis]|uniref:(wild Malaysian banana) hypothetical protein n=1 Tax=Musa acuminata subsp. malaccensis TaxID=214687 RepID=A0A804IWK9_MUSAM|nr:unnamed protein product [Musa acuminata subsp. malaccensis]